MHEQLLELHETLINVGASIDEEVDTITNAIKYVQQSDTLIKNYANLVTEIIGVNKQTINQYHQVVQLLSRMIIELVPQKDSGKIVELLDGLIMNLSKLH